MDTSTHPYIFRSKSENTALSTHTYDRLQGTSHGMTQHPHPAPMASHLASKQYVEQHRAFVEHQRCLHDEERRLWQMERDELHDRIQELEQMVRSLGGQVHSSFKAAHRGSSVSTQATEPLSQVSSNTSTGDEFWRGGGGINGAPVTRTFSEPTARSSSLANTNSNHLPSIAERPESGPRKKSVGFSAGEPSIIGQDFHIHPIPAVALTPKTLKLDGINFKSGILATNGVHKEPRSRSQSPKQASMINSTQIPMARAPSSEAREPQPQVIEMSSSGLTESVLLVKDAGHTPLARLADPEADNSAAATPMVHPQDLVAYTEDEIPAKAPSERAESYFPVSDEAAQLPPVEANDEHQVKDAPDDPSLKGPLALTNDSSSTANTGFLSALDSKLLKAQKASEESEEKEDPMSPESRPKDDADGNSFENDEQEPKLRIKRSMNFGSAFGSSTVGRNI